MPRPPFAVFLVVFLVVPACFLGSNYLANTSCRIGTASAIIPTLTTAPAAMTGGCGAFVPVVCFEDYDVGGWRQDRKDEEHLRMRQQLVEVHARRIVCPAGEREHADAVDAHEYSAEESPSGSSGQIGAVQFGGTEPHAQNDHSDKAENPGQYPVEARPVLAQEGAGG